MALELGRKAKCGKCAKKLTAVASKPGAATFGTYGELVGMSVYCVPCGTPFCGSCAHIDWQPGPYSEVVCPQCGGSLRPYER